MKRLFFVLTVVVLALPSPLSAETMIAVWADDTTDGLGLYGKTNAMVSAINSLIPGYRAEFVTTDQLENASYLDAFSAIVVTRAGQDFGWDLSVTEPPPPQHPRGSPAAATNVRDYVHGYGEDGKIVLFANDWADNLPGSNSGDSYDATVTRLILNAVQVAAASGHGYVGELNGTAMAMTSEGAEEYVPLELIPGEAGKVVNYFNEPMGVQLTAVGLADPVTAGVASFFVPDDYTVDGKPVPTIYRPNLTGVPEDYILAKYVDGYPAIVANYPAVPEPSSLVMFSGLAITGIALNHWRRRRKT